MHPGAHGRRLCRLRVLPAATFSGPPHHPRVSTSTIAISMDSLVHCVERFVIADFATRHARAPTVEASIMILAVRHSRVKMTTWLRRPYHESGDGGHCQ